MPINNNRLIQYGISLGKERVPVILGEPFEDFSQAKQQLTEDAQELQVKCLKVVVIKPGQEYKIASMSENILH